MVWLIMLIVVSIQSSFERLRICAQIDPFLGTPCFAQGVQRIMNHSPVVKQPMIPPLNCRFQVKVPDGFSKDP